MTRRQISFIATVIVLIGITFSHPVFVGQGNAKGAVSEESIEILAKTNKAISDVVSSVTPSIVNISSSRTVKGAGMPAPFFNDPFFRRFFGDEFRPQEKPREHKKQGLGSGVIIDSKGYILTNNHVIKDAYEIKVTLLDKREFKGRVIGTDQKTDLAVIKIEAQDLPVVKPGDSDLLKPGDMVFAIGNPFGLNRTVTSGIVSATGRANVGIADYEDFIQTDAAINPGNSGGALVNIKGELVGINTAIFSTTGGYQGIGFAIPSNMAKTVMENLITKGKVVRGWLGITIQQVTPDLARQFGLAEQEGALLADVSEDGPAAKAGLKRGDVIAEFEGRKVKDVTALRNMVAATAPGKKVKVRVLRDGNTMDLEAVISEAKADTITLSKTFDNQLRGVNIQGLTTSLKKEMGIPARISGVVVTDVSEGSPAEGILQREDVIMEVNRQHVENVEEYEAAVSKVKADQNVLLLIFRKESTVFLTLQPVQNGPKN